MFLDSKARVKSPARHLEEPDSSPELLLRTLIANYGRGRAFEARKAVQFKVTWILFLYTNKECPVSTDMPLYIGSVQIKYVIQM